MGIIGSKSKKITVLSTHEDGKNYIELIKPSTKLGELLNPDYTDNLEIFLGKVLSVRRLMEYLNKEDYPQTFLTKKKLFRKDIESIRNLKSRHVDGYWAIILHYLIQKVRENTNLRTLLEDNDLDFAATTGLHQDKVLGNTLNVRKHVNQLASYIGCIRIVSMLVKDNKLDDNKHIEKLFYKELGST